MTTLLRFDPMREFDRLFDQAWGPAGRIASVPMDAYRHGDTFVLNFDLPGVDPDTIDLTVERNALTVSAERHWQPVEGDQVVASERRHGSFSRQLYLSDSLDRERIHATYENGVLSVTVPLAERSKARRIEIARDGGRDAIVVENPA
jgi:HSP20 family protein